jgi:hypothetical protein
MRRGVVAWRSYHLKFGEEKLGGKILIFKELYIIIFLKIFEKNMMAGGPQE